MYAFPMSQRLPRHVIADGRPVELLERAESGVVYEDDSCSLTSGMFVAVDEHGELILVAVGYIYITARNKTFRRRHAKHR